MFVSAFFLYKVYAMSEYDVEAITQERLILIVASTYGNGGPPSNGEVKQFTVKFFHLNFIVTFNFTKMNSVHLYDLFNAHALLQHN